MDRGAARSRHGYIIMYAVFPVVWKSQFQTEIKMSSTESEHMGLSYALRGVITIMQLLKELKRTVFPIESTTLKVTCKVF